MELTNKARIFQIEARVSLAVLGLGVGAVRDFGPSLGMILTSGGFEAPAEKTGLLVCAMLKFPLLLSGWQRRCQPALRGFSPLTHVPDFSLGGVFFQQVMLLDSRFLFFSTITL